MANIVRNRLIMEGIEEAPIFSFDEETGKKKLDFNKIIPMPESLNLTEGSQTMTALEALAAKIKKTIFGKEFKEYTFQERPDPGTDILELGLKYMKNIVKYHAATWPEYRYRNSGVDGIANCTCPPEDLILPCGEIENEAVDAVVAEINKSRCRFYTFGSLPNLVENMSWQELNDMANLGLQYVQNIVQHGAATWYDWRIQNWGTKWNAMETSNVGPNQIEFETANGSPLGVMAAFAEMYPDKDFNLTWAEECAGYNVGCLEHDNGELFITEYEEESPAALEVFVQLWGDTSSLTQDGKGLWVHFKKDDAAAG